MPSEAEMIAIQKAAVLDLLTLFGFDPAKSYTSEQIREIMLAYIKGKEGQTG